MSRIGDRKLVIPAGVTVTVDNDVVTVKGPKGELTTKVINDLEVKVEGDTLEVLKGNDSSETNMMQGTMNANIKAEIENDGVSDAYIPFTPADLELINIEVTSWKDNWNDK